MSDARSIPTRPSPFDPPGAPTPASPGGAIPRRLSWPLIAGLSALALLWPLAEITGMPRGFARAAVILSIIAACWIGVVGLGRFPRPVLTLTLTGLGAGLLSHALSYAFGGGAPLWALPISLALQAGWGALAGLVAWGIQTLLGGARR